MSGEHEVIILKKSSDEFDNKKWGWFDWLQLSKYQSVKIFSF